MQTLRNKWIIAVAAIATILVLGYSFQDCHIRQLRKSEDSIKAYQRSFDSLRAIVATSKDVSHVLDSITKANAPVIKQAVTNYYTIKSPNFTVIDSSFKDSSYRFLLSISNQ